MRSVGLRMGRAAGHFLLILDGICTDFTHTLGGDVIGAGMFALPGLATLEDAGFVDDFGDIFFLAIGHDMHAGDALDLLHLVDDVDAELLAFLLLVLRAFEAGARGYLLKDGTEDDLAEHVLSLNAGGSPMTPIIARQLLARLSPAPLRQGALPAAEALTARERDILAKLARGYTYSETAEILGIAASTVQSHVKNIYSKLAVHSKTEAIYEARQLGLL